MRGTIEINGWSHHRTIRLRPGLFSEVYKNREGWTAHEVFAGGNNHLLGLVVYDEKGKSQGTVQSTSELP